MELPLIDSNTLTRAEQMFTNIDDLINNGSLKLQPQSLVHGDAETRVVYTNYVTVTVGHAHALGAVVLPLHINEVQRVVIVAKGKFLATVGHTQLTVNEGDVVRIAPRQLQSFAALEADSELVSVYYPRQPAMSKFFRKLFTQTVNP